MSQPRARPSRCASECVYYARGLRRVLMPLALNAAAWTGGGRLYCCGAGINSICTHGAVRASAAARCASAPLLPSMKRAACVTCHTCVTCYARVRGDVSLALAFFLLYCCCILLQQLNPRLKPCNLSLERLHLRGKCRFLILQHNHLLRSITAGVVSSASATNSADISRPSFIPTPLLVKSMLQS